MLDFDLGANLAVNEGLMWVQMADKGYYEYCGTMRDMGDLLGRVDMGETSGTGGKLGEGRSHGG
jgi:hypothetical protein